jgi:hypothetical protein
VYPKVSGLSHNEINSNNKHSLRSNTKGYGGKTHYTDSQNSSTTAPSGRKLYHLQFSLQVASLGTFGYTLIYVSLFVVSFDLCYKNAKQCGEVIENNKNLILNVTSKLKYQ